MRCGLRSRAATGALPRARPGFRARTGRGRAQRASASRGEAGDENGKRKERASGEEGLLAPLDFGGYDASSSGLGSEDEPPSFYSFFTEEEIVGPR